jgi:hypothetical protein
MKRSTRFRKAALEAAEFDANELVVLDEVCGVMDEIDALPAGAIAERRMQRALLSKLLGMIPLPHEEPAVPVGLSVRGRRAALARWGREADSA